jgi:hypothetical protein
VETVEASLRFKGLEFATFEIRVMDSLPDAEIFEGISVSHPTVNQRVITEFLGHIRQRNVVLLSVRKDGDGGSLNLDGRFPRFAHESSYAANWFKET